jgi:hypothetical protein
MQLHTALCYTYGMIFITIFKIKQIIYTLKGSPTPHLKILWAHLLHGVTLR